MRVGVHLVSRQSRRRRPRRAEPAPVLETAPLPLTDVERDRLHQRYAHMRGRSVTLGWASLGIPVAAGTPEEMAAKTDAIIVELTRRQPPS